MKRVYLAHPLGSGPEREANRHNAAKWGALIAQTFGVAVSADWIWLSGVLDETAENRALGLKTDMAHVVSCDEVWLTGGRISDGMLQEATAAIGAKRPVVDLTWLGYTCPESLPVQAVKAILELRLLRLSQAATQTGPYHSNQEYK